VSVRADDGHEAFGDEREGRVAGRRTVRAGYRLGVDLRERSFAQLTAQAR